MSAIRQIRDAVIAAIEAGSYSRDVTVEASYEPEIEAHGVKAREARVFVRRSETAEAGLFSYATRSQNGVPLTFDILVVGGVNSPDTAEVDKVQDVAEEIDLLLRSRANDQLLYDESESLFATWVAGEVQTLADAEQPGTHGLAMFNVPHTYVYERKR